MPRRILISLVVLAALVLPATALATTRTVHEGPVTASLSYTGSLPQFHNIRLSISQAGKKLYSQPVTSKACGKFCDPSILPGQPPLQLADLAQDGEPDVLLNLFTGGAHCCSLVQVFSYDPGTQTFGMVEHDFGDPGYRLENLPINGQKHPEFVTADDTFAGRFTDFAASGLPVQVLDLFHRQFQNVTRNYPSLVSRDAARWLKAYKSMARSGYRDSVGVIAAWAADEDQLGHLKLVARYLRTQAAAGHLNSALGTPNGVRFVAQLQVFLRKQGYTTRQLGLQ
jgi:hypothetical protein